MALAGSGEIRNANLVSYSRDDGRLVTQLAEGLEAAWPDVWYDVDPGGGGACEGTRLVWADAYSYATSKPQNQANPRPRARMPAGASALVRTQISDSSRSGRIRMALSSGFGVRVPYGAPPTQLTGPNSTVTSVASGRRHSRRHPWRDRADRRSSERSSPWSPGSVAAVRQRSATSPGIGGVARTVRSARAMLLRSRHPPVASGNAASAWPM